MSVDPSQLVQRAHDDWLADKVARGDTDEGFPGDHECYYADDDELWAAVERELGRLEEAEFRERLHPRDRRGRWRDIPHLIHAILPRALVVGGAVRDEVMGRPVKDHDFVAVGLNHRDLRVALEPHGRVDDLVVDERPVGVRFYPHDPVPGAPVNGIEIAPPRTERSTGPGRHDFEIVADASVPFEEDARRRDFTVNAIGKDSEGNLVDPLGGAEDARNGVLRVIGSTAFRDDGLRLARGLRFISTHSLEPDAATEAQMREWSRRIRDVSGERVQIELSKLLMGDDPAKALRVARDTGVLAHMLPDMAPALGFEQKSKYHGLPLDEHTFEAVQAAADAGAPLEVRLAALLHDIGKPESSWEDAEGRRHYYANAELGKEPHEVVGARLAGSVLDDLRYPNEVIDEVTALVREHMFQDHTKLGRDTGTARDKHAARKYLYRLAKTYGKDRARPLAVGLAQLKQADIRAKDADESPSLQSDVAKAKAWEELVRSDVGPFHVSHLNIDGNDLIALGGKPGPKFGEVLDQLTRDVIGSPHLNEDREWLRERAGKLLRKGEVRSDAPPQLTVAPVERLHAPSEFLTLPKSGKLKEAATSAMAAVDRLLRVPEMHGPIPVRATAGKNNRGGFLRQGKKVKRPEWEGPTVRMTGFGPGQSQRPAKRAAEIQPGDVLVRGPGYANAVRRVETFEKEIGFGRPPMTLVRVVTDDGTATGERVSEYKPDELVPFAWVPPPGPPPSTLYPHAIQISVRPDELAFDPEASLVHEFAHYMDNQAFGQYPLGRGMASTHAAWRMFDQGKRDEALAEAREKDSPSAAVYEHLEANESPLADWYEAVMATPEVEQLHTASGAEYATHKYLVSPAELFARSFTQWVAMRSGDPSLQAWLRESQNQPETMMRRRKVYDRGLGKNVEVPYEAKRPNYLKLREWQDENFEPVAAALDRLFEGLGWLRGGAGAGRRGDGGSDLGRVGRVGGRPGGGDGAELAVAANQIRAGGATGLGELAMRSPPTGGDRESRMVREAGVAEAHGLQTTTRVFFAYAEGSPIGVLTVDPDRGTVELVYVPERFRRRGVAKGLLEAARRHTGMPLTTDTGERSPEGEAWASAQGLTGGSRRKLTQREANGLGARLLFHVYQYESATDAGPLFPETT